MLKNGIRRHLVHITDGRRNDLRKPGRHYDVDSLHAGSILVRQKGY